MTGRDRAPALLARNMLAALVTYRCQLALLRILRLMGPLTTRELVPYCSTHVPVSYKTLQRLLTKLRAAKAVQTYPVPTLPATRQVLWALPGQPKPDRRAQPRETRDRRQTTERRQPTTSWWLDTDRQTFQAALETRWHN